MGNERSYAPGWCTWWVAHELAWVPAGLGNADTWPARAKAKGLNLTLTPTKGAVVCYGPGGGYSELGHVAVVVAVYHRGEFEVSEMAYVAWDKADLRTSNMQDVAAFILPPGAVPTGAGAIKPPPPPTPAGEVGQFWAFAADVLSRQAPALAATLALARAHLARV